MVLCTILLSLMSSIVNLNSTSPQMNCIDHYKIECDSITRAKLCAYALEGLKIIDSSRTPTEQEAIILIRTFNTLLIDTAFKSKKELKLWEVFVLKFKQRFLAKENLEQLNITLGKGLTWYSVKYDLYVGVDMVLRTKDIYFIKEEKKL